VAAWCHHPTVAIHLSPVVVVDVIDRLLMASQDAVVYQPTGERLC
jgi:hypothetical protein